MVGAHVDPVFGPVVVVGDGGKYVEALQDVAVLVPPFAAADVTAALRTLRIAPLLEGVRGDPPLDVEALAEVAVAVGRLIVDAPRGDRVDRRQPGTGRRPGRGRRWRWMPWSSGEAEPSRRFRAKERRCLASNLLSYVDRRLVVPCTNSTRCTSSCPMPGRCDPGPLQALRPVAGAPARRHHALAARRGGDDLPPRRHHLRGVRRQGRGRRRHRAADSRST